MMRIRHLLMAAMLAMTASAQAQTAAARYPFTIDEDALAGAPDRSDMNRALTPADRIVARDGHFYRVGADGKPGTADDSRVRLFGINLSFATNFPSASDAPRLAKRLRKAGFNAVRLHHMDFYVDDSSESPRGILTTGPYPSFNPVAVQRLRQFIGALAAEGIYVDINLYVSYRFRPAIDDVPAFGGGIEALPIGSPVHVYHPRMRALQETFTRELISALGVAGHPALAMVEINNESSLLSSWMRGKWREATPPGYVAELESQWNTWLRARYPDLDAACRAWNGCEGRSAAGVPLPTPLDNAQSSSMWQAAVTKLRAKLASPDVGVGLTPEAPEGAARRLDDFLRFLVDTDRAYLKRMRTVIHEATDAMLPVAGTQMSFGGVLNFDSHADMDYIDEHLYVDHPHFPNGFSELRDWRIRDVSLTGGEVDRLLARGLRRDHRRPFVLSEFNHPFPSPQAAEALPVLATVAAMQDWDGIFFFDYLNTSTWSTAPANFTLSGDWGKYVHAGQSAQIFRGGAMPTLPTQHNVALPVAARYAIGGQGKDDALDRFAADSQSVRAALAWQQRLAVDLAPDAAPAAVSPPAAPQTGVTYDAAQKRLLLSTPQVWGVFGRPSAGWQGGDAWQLALQPGAESRHVSVLLTPVDGKPLATSQRLLLSLGSPTVGTQPGSMPARPKELVPYRNERSLWTLEPDPSALDKPSGSRYATAPTWLRRQALCVRWNAAPSDRAVTVYPLDGKGARQAPLEASQLARRGEVVTLKLASVASPWYEVVVDGAAPVSSAPVADACPS